MFILKASPRAAAPLVIRGQKRYCIVFVGVDVAAAAVAAAAAVVVVVVVVVVVSGMLWERQPDFTCPGGSGKLNL